jgi:hypothetical protein
MVTRFFSSDRAGRQAPAGQRPAGSLLVLLLVASIGMAARPVSRGHQPAGVAVRYTEGTVHGFLELRTESGTLLAHGDLLQVARGAEVETRALFHFSDSSVFDETVRFRQDSVFTLESYALVQSGPAFSDDLTATLTRSGQYSVVSKSHHDEDIKRYTGTLDLPADVYNGMVITVAKNLLTGGVHTVHMVGFTPAPRLIELEMAPSVSRPVMLGDHPEAAVRFTLTPKLGGLLSFFAAVAGRTPPPSTLWIVTDDIPAFMQFEGPLYAGPVWRLTQTSPQWSPSP